jgi:hypothetical protein
MNNNNNNDINKNVLTQRALIHNTQAHKESVGHQLVSLSVRVYLVFLLTSFYFGMLNDMS